MIRRVNQLRNVAPTYPRCFKSDSKFFSQYDSSQVGEGNANFVVAELPQLNLLDSNVIVQLGVSVDYLLYPNKASNSVTTKAKSVY